MRKQQQSTIIEMANILAQANNQLCRILNSGLGDNDVNEMSTTLLTKSQGVAINIGQIIEESEGDGFITVKYLEDYCELLYSVNEEIRDSNIIVNVEKIRKRLNKLLLKIKNSIEHDIKIKKEAVFLPYKASMWDSLESVWRAADLDPECDAFVIPIPYYDKNPDGSLREEHYEGDEFPADVPITHYSSYDFGKHHPDVIFIHNPYDYGNLVTTIHPFFYAENLKKVTDCLVYIPYFATASAISESKSWCPVFEYVDYIVIQSDSYRKYYHKSIPDEKFLSFGSPKFDKVIRSCNEVVQKKDWEKIIKNRKVFFYNTSLNTMLSDTILYFKKMEYVFNVFKQNPEVCLLWRPHPLFESTIYSMRPEFLPMYNALKNEFLSHKNWIYDDTADIEGTIALSDAYIGDMASSVVALFGIIGKPIFLLDYSKGFFDSFSKKRNFLPNLITAKETSENLIVYNNSLYMRADENEEYKYVNNFAEYNEDALYSSSYQYNNKIFVFPAVAQDIVVIENGETKRIELEEYKWGYLFVKTVIDGKYAFLIPYEYPAIVRVDMETNEIIYLNGVAEFVGLDDIRLDTYAHCINDGYLYIFNTKGTQFLVINTITLESEIHNVDLNSNLIYGDFINEDEIVLLENIGNRIYKLNVRRNEYKEYKLDFLMNDKRNFHSFEMINSNIVIIAPFNNNNFVFFDLEKETFYENNMGVIFEKNSTKRETTVGALGKINGKLAYNDYINNKIYIYSDLKFHQKELKVSEEDLEKSEIIVGNVSRELGYCGVEKRLGDLEKMLKGEILFDKKEQLKSFSKINANSDGTAGEQIYKYLLGGVKWAGRAIDEKKE